MSQTAAKSIFEDRKRDFFDESPQFSSERFNEQVFGEK